MGRASGSVGFTSMFGLKLESFCDGASKRCVTTTVTNAVFRGRQVTLFEQRNFAGRRLDLTSDCPRLSDKNFPERCNSAQVESGA